MSRTGLTSWYPLGCIPSGGSREEWISFSSLASGGYIPWLAAIFKASNMREHSSHAGLSLVLFFCFPPPLMILVIPWGSLDGSQGHMIGNLNFTCNFSWSLPWHLTYSQVWRVGMETSWGWGLFWLRQIPFFTSQMPRTPMVVSVGMNTSFGFKIHLLHLYMVYTPYGYAYFDKLELL